MDRQHRLRRSADFQRVRRTGRSYAHPLVILVASPNDTSTTRFGITTARGIGSAVRRNRAKRRLRELARLSLPRLAPGWDLLLIARPGAESAPAADLRQAVEDLFRKAGLWMEAAQDDRPGTPTPA